MKNDFPQSVYELFDMGGFCRDWEDGRNDADAMHHILGRVSRSPYNACPLNNRRNHMPEGRKYLPAIHSHKSRKRYLIKTKKYLDKLEYKPNEVDLAFLETHKKYYD